jgi:hypothetical protein
LIIQSLIFFTVQQLKDVRTLLNANKLVHGQRLPKKPVDKPSKNTNDEESGAPSSSSNNSEGKEKSEETDGLSTTSGEECDTNARANSQDDKKDTENPTTQSNEEDNFEEPPSTHSYPNDEVCSKHYHPASDLILLYYFRFGLFAIWKNFYCSCPRYFF